MRRQPLEPSPEVVAEEADQAAEERRRVRRPSTGGSVEPRRGAGARPANGSAAGRRRLEDRDRVGGQVRPAGVAARPGALEQGQARQVAERSATSIGRTRRELRQRLERGRAARRRRNGRPRRGSPGDDRAAGHLADPASRREDAASAVVGATQEAHGASERPRDRHRSRPAGPANAITDVAGVRVGHATIVRGEGPLVVGQGPVRTGVTMVVPHDGDLWTQPLFAGSHTLNGNGELTASNGSARRA